MPRDGSGGYSLPAGNPVVTGTTISSTVQNNTTSDIATALTGSVAADGQTTMTGNLAMGGNKVTGVGNASAGGDAANLTTVQAQIDTRFVSGRVLQEALSTDAGSSTTSATLANVSGSQQTITPKSTTSKLLVECAFQATVTASGGGVNSVAGYRLYNNTGAADIGVEYTVGVSTAAGANTQTETAVVLKAIVANSATTLVGFVLRAHRSVGTPTVFGQNQVWTIREIQN